MSISSSTARIQYTLSGAAQVLTVPFVFLAASDLVVTKTAGGADTLLVISTDYTVSGGGSTPATGTVTMVAGISGDMITIARGAAILQPAVYASNSAFPAKTNETVADRLTMFAQQQQLSVGRSLRIPVTQAELGEMAVATWKNKNIGMDANGIPTPVDPVIAGSITTGTVIEISSLSALRALSVSGLTTGRQARVSGYSSSADGGDGLFVYNSASAVTDNNGTIIAPTVGSGRWLRAYSGQVNCRWFGAKGDGSTNDTTALQAVIDLCVATSGGARGYVPAGTYIVTGLSIRGNNVAISGDGSAVTTIRRKASSAAANVLELGDIVSGNAAIAYSNINVRGFTLDGNKANVAQPAGDLTDWGMPLTKISNFFFDDLRAINCWNGGVGIFINSNYGLGSCYVENCGVGSTGVGTEPGVDVNSSKYCRLTVTAKDCQNGFRLLDNCWGNIVDALIINATTSGVICTNQTVNESHDNIVRAVIEGGCTGAGLVVTTNFKNSLFFVTAKGLTGYAVHDTLNSTYVCTGNVFIVASQLGGIQSCLIENSSNIWSIATDRDGRTGAQGSVYAVDVNGNNNVLSVNLVDTTTWQVRGVVFRAGATTNKLATYTYTNTADPFSDSGTGTQWIGLTPTWINAAYAAGWGTAYGAPYAPSGYSKDGLGNVRLRGTAAKGGAVAPETIFTLPAGYRPSFKLACANISNALAATIAIDTSGNVILLAGSGVDVKLDGITFPTTY